MVTLSLYYNTIYKSEGVLTSSKRYLIFFSFFVYIYKIRQYFSRPIFNIKKIIKISKISKKSIS